MSTMIFETTNGKVRLTYTIIASASWKQKMVGKKEESWEQMVANEDESL